MKHKTNVGPGLIVALGTPADGAGKMNIDPGARQTGRSALPGAPNALSSAADVDTVPLDMLSMPDDQEQMQPPEVGDVVNYQVTGKVVAIEGNVAMVQRQSINGRELPEGEDPSSSRMRDSDAGGSGGVSDTGDRTTGAGQDEGQSLRGQAAGIGMLS